MYVYRDIYTTTAQVGWEVQGLVALGAGGNVDLAAVAASNKLESGGLPAHASGGGGAGVGGGHELEEPEEWAQVLQKKLLVTGGRGGNVSLVRCLGLQAK